MVERWMIDRLAPEKRLREAAEGFNVLGRVAEHVPQLLQGAEALALMMAEGGVRLHPESARQIAEAHRERIRPTSVAMWLAAAAAGIYAVIRFLV